MDEKNAADIQEIEDENLKDATGGTRLDGSVKIICEMNAEDGGESGAEDESDGALPPNPFMCPLCRKPIQFCTCHK